MAGEEKPKKAVRPVRAADAKAHEAGDDKGASAAKAGRQAEELKLEAQAEGEEEARVPQGEKPGARKAQPEKPAGGKPKAAKAKAQPAKRAEGRDQEEGGEGEGDEEEDEEGEASGKAGEGKKRKSRPRPRPTLDAGLTTALALRRQKNAKRPNFRREEWFRYQRLGEKWRYPQGIQSKMRRHWGTHADVVSIGHRGPKAARGLHPSGFREVLIHNAKGLEGVDPAREAVRIAASVGRRKREEIQTDAKKLGIRVLNWRQY